MLDPKEEARFVNLRNMCSELKVPAPPEIMIGLKVHDKNGIIIFDDIQRGHSWTRNFYNFMFSGLSDAKSAGTATYAAGFLSSKGITGSIYAAQTIIPARPNATLGSNNGYWGAIGVDTQGIVVGTNTTAFSVGQHSLLAKILHGLTAGKFSYSEMAAGVVSYTVETKTWNVSHFRIFNNNSGGEITVGEVGINTNWYIYQTAGTYLIERSVLSPTVVVPNGAQLTVTYTISMDFSSID